MSDNNIVYKNIDELIPYEKNPRINDNAVQAVAKSIKEFGFKQPVVVDKDNVIVVGHTRVKAAKEINMNEIPCIIADDLSKEEVKAYRLTDNKVAELALWDWDLLDEELEELQEFNFDMEDFGFESNLADEIEDDEIEEIEPEVKFTEELGEESNYIVLKFDTDVDWLRLESLFNLPRVKALNSKKGYEQIGIGRVVNGNDFIDEILKNNGGGFVG